MNLSNLIDMKPSKLLKSTATTNSDAELTVFPQNTSVFREKQINCQIWYTSRSIEQSIQQQNLRVMWVTVRAKICQHGVFQTG